MHGPWHPILHNAPRSRKERNTQTTGPQYVPVIENDYSWYRPLDVSRKEIRILFLEPEPLDSPKEVVVHVFNASLLDPTVPKLYGCLSYCWGSPAITETIQVMYTEKSDEAVNGLVTTQTRFQITANLNAALRVLRNKLSRPVLWADALCIDQSDIDERGTQVSLMAEIYTQAVQTIVWLGESDSTTKMVFDFADLITTMEVKPQEVDAKAMAAGINCRRLRPLAKGELEFVEEEVSSDDFYKMRWGIQALLARPFFRRAWVLQEVGLADREQIVVHCGQYSLWWQVLQNLTSFEWRAAAHQGQLPIDPERDRRLNLPIEHPHMVPGSHYTLPEIWSYLRRYCSNTKRGKILDLVFRRLEIQASDPRDQLTALFGLAEECQSQPRLHSGFCADYSRDVAETYMLFTRAMIEKLHNLIVLSAIDVFQPSETRKERKIPSWVPEYDTHNNLRRTLGYLGDGYYNASAGSDPCILNRDSGTLMLTGIIIDKVSLKPNRGPFLMEVETENPNNTAKPAILKVKGELDGISYLWQMVSTNVKNSPVAHQDLIEQFILTLMCCRRTYWDRAIIKSVKDLPGLLAEFVVYWKSQNGDVSSLPPRTALYESHNALSELSEEGHAGKFGQRMYYTCHQRSFIVTESGFLALVPPGTRNGDVIVVCEGANVPFVLRRLATSGRDVGQRMQFIGECYVHGMMHGEAMDAVEAGYLEGELFYLV